jgi:hypothetical protein
MVDRGNTGRSASNLWVAFGRRFSVGTGALVALVSLLSDAPVHTASGRGAVCVLALLVVTRIARHAMDWTERLAEAPGAASKQPARETKT